ncbi:TerB family tellurite resistance protein [Sphingobacterium cellulitidis]|uniref:TerB family tellurite resistance protein n=1 Tax=Sphingobacterium cellulitidis TaxID=1768011 RepID=UPI003C7BED31
MKKYRLLLLFSLCLSIPAKRLVGQSADVSQLLLNIEKLTQLKKILLQMRQSYSILSKGYGMVSELSQGNFNLHRVFLEGLMEASPSVRNYRKVKEAVNLQLHLVSLCNSSIKRYRNSGAFSIGELRYLASVQQKVLSESLGNLQELAVLVSGGLVQMDDGERLSAIDGIHRKMEETIGFLRRFLGSTDMLRLQRIRHGRDLGQRESFFRTERVNPK